MPGVFVAVLRRLPGARGGGIKVCRNVASPSCAALPPDVSFSNLRSYCTVWSKNKTQYISYGTSKKLSPAHFPCVEAVSAPNFFRSLCSSPTIVSKAAEEQVSLYGGTAGAVVDGAIPQPKKRRKTTLNSLKSKYLSRVPVTMVTAYDYPSAQLAAQAGVDMILVGDSLGMVVQGLDSTVPVTMEDMVYHCKAAVRGGGGACFVVGDMPFGSYLTTDDAVRNAARLMKEGGVDAIKLEGGARVAAHVRAIVDAGIPVIGHVGLTPQTHAALGGFTLQAKSLADATALCEDARALETAGACVVVLEMVPCQVAHTVTSLLSIPTIGIGAGNGCSGQVLVMHDMVGLFDKFKPKFCKRYAEVGAIIRTALAAYCEDVEQGRFPAKEHWTDASPDLVAALRSAHGLPPLQPQEEQQQSAQQQQPGQQPTPQQQQHEVPLSSAPAARAAAPPHIPTHAPGAAESVLERLPPPAPTQAPARSVRRVAVVGGGAMGSLLAAKLHSLPGLEVWQVSGWGAHVHAVSQSGLDVVQEGPGGLCSKVNVHARCTSDPAVATKGGLFDLAFVMVKSSSTRAAGTLCASLLHPDAVCVTLQNGVGNADVLAECVGAHRVVAGVTLQAATMLQPGRVKHSADGPTTLMAPPSLQAAAETIASLLGAAGLPTALQPPALAQATVWQKLLVNSVINPLTAILNVRNGEIANPPHRPLVTALVAEFLAVARGSGVALLPACATQDAAVELVVQAAHRTAPNLSSMWTDVQRGVDTEVDVINGFVCRQGRAVGVPTPSHDMVVSLIKCLENQRGWLPKRAAAVDDVSPVRATAGGGNTARAGGAHVPSLLTDADFASTMGFL